jgi:GntR family transcriptional regulator
MSGQRVTYATVHCRASRVLPLECAHADGSCSGRLEAAFRHDAPPKLVRRDGRHGCFYYAGDPLDGYMRLCRSHHRRYDASATIDHTTSGQLSYRLPINADLPVPAYAQLAGILRRRIEAGDITGKLPSEKTLAQEFGLAQNTVRRALDVLREEGLITSVQGLGSFVRQGERP